MDTKEEIKKIIIDNPNYYFRMNNVYLKNKEIIQIIINNAFYNPKEKMLYYKLVNYITNEKQLEQAKEIIKKEGYIELIKDLKYLNLNKIIKYSQISIQDQSITYIKNIISKFNKETQDIIELRYGLNGEKYKLDKIANKYNYTSEKIIKIQNDFIQQAKKIIEKDKKEFEEKKDKYIKIQTEKNIYQELEKYSKQKNKLLDISLKKTPITIKYNIKTIGDYAILNQVLYIDQEIQIKNLSPSAYLLYELKDKLDKLGYKITYNELLNYPLSYYHINFYASFFNITYKNESATLKDLLIQIELNLNTQKNDKYIKIDKYFKIKSEIKKIFNNDKTTEYESILELPLYKLSAQKIEDKKTKQNIKYLQLKQYNNLLEIINLNQNEIDKLKEDEKTYQIIEETLNSLRLRLNMTEQEINEYKNKSIIINAYNNEYIPKYIKKLDIEKQTNLRLLKLSSRTYNALKRQNINTIEELLKLDINTLSGFPKIGEKTSKEIEECLKRYKENLEKDNIKIKTKSF